MTWRGVSASALMIVLAACSSGGGTSTVTTASSSPPVSPSATASAQPSIQIASIPEGTYESEVTRKDALRYGVPTCDPTGVDENTGHFTLTFKGGRFRETLSADHPVFNPLFTGVYSGTGHVVSLIFDSNTADEAVDKLRWSFDGKALTFKVLSALPDAQPAGSHLCVARMVYESHKWVKTA
jgi:hypothetical protein